MSGPLAAGDPRSPDAVAWGIVYEPAQAGPGQGVWRCIRVEGPVEWGGRVSTFLDVLGLDGRRLVGVRVRWFWRDGQDFRATEPKPGEPFSVDFVMNAGGPAYGLQIADGQPSDIVRGFGLGSFKPHHVFKVTYQYQIQGEQPPEPPVEPPDAAREAIDEAIRLLQKARGML